MSKVFLTVVLSDRLKGGLANGEKPETARANDCQDRCRKGTWPTAAPVGRRPDRPRASGGLQLHDVALRPAFSSPVSHPERVFTYEGKPVRYVNTKAWRNALKRAGIAEFRWHDLRHTSASWLIQNGMPLYDLQEMGDWKSAAMVRRYAHLAPAHMARHAAVLDGLLRVSSTAQ